MAYRTATITREECATTETLQVLGQLEEQVASLEHALETLGDQFPSEARAEGARVLAKLRRDVEYATLAHDEALATWQAAGAPTYQPHRTRPRSNRA